MRVKSAAAATLIALTIRYAHSFRFEEPCFAQVGKTNRKLDALPKDLWQPTPRNANPKAVELLKDAFYWDSTDDDSPFGNDNGADALTFYRQWRNQHPAGNSVDFIQELLTRFQAPFTDWKRLRAQEINSVLDMHRGYVVTTGDDAIVSVAFAELVLDGRIDERVRQLALQAIKNEQGLIKWRRWTVPMERTVRLEKMKSVLLQAPK